jgi:hypothetical protein
LKKTIDKLDRISGSKTSEISARLTIMEMKVLARNFKEVENKNTQSV